MPGPFDLADDRAYAAWREAKLAAHPARVEEIVVPVTNPRALAPAEHAALADRIARCNMVIYASGLG